MIYCFSINIRLFCVQSVRSRAKICTVDSRSFHLRLASHLRYDVIPVADLFKSVKSADCVTAFDLFATTVSVVRNESDIRELLPIQWKLLIKIVAC